MSSMFEVGMDSGGMPMSVEDAEFRSQFEPGNYVVDDFTGGNTAPGMGGAPTQPAYPDLTLAGTPPPGLQPTTGPSQPAGTPGLPPNFGGASLDPTALDDTSLLNMVRAGPPGRTPTTPPTGPAPTSGGGAPLGEPEEENMDEDEMSLEGMSPADIARAILQKRAEERREVSESFQKKAAAMGKMTSSAGY